MYKIILVSILLMSSLIAFGQTKDSLSLADETIYEKVDTVASFPGGKQAWNKFVGNTLDAAVGLENGAKKGTYKVKVRFTVTKDGTLKNFEPVTKFKHGFEEEVIRMMKLSPKWIPAKKNGINVNSKVEQEQIFVISVG
jgi:hypothetical protein